MKQFWLLSTCLTLWGLSIPAFALEPGLYHGGGSRYIAIGRSGDRLCYQGSSPRGVTTATLIKVGDRYQVYGWEHPVLLEAKGTDVIVLGGSTYQRIKGELVDERAMANCLSSTKNFHSQR